MMSSSVYVKSESDACLCGCVVKLALLQGLPHPSASLLHYSSLLYCSFLPARSLHVSLVCSMSVTTGQTVRHPLYYFPNGTHIFRVGTNHFHLQHSTCSNSEPRSKICFTSCIMISLPYTQHFSRICLQLVILCNSSIAVEGKSNMELIVLEGEQKATFDLFLDHIHGW